MRSEILLGVAVVISLTGSAWAGETVILPGGVPLTLAIVPAGTFTMGSPDGERGRFTDEGSERDVTLSQSYLVGTHEVTQGQWAAVYGNNPSGYASCGLGCPVETVTWFEALAFANAVSTNEGLPSCYTLTDCTGTPGTGMTCDEATFVGVACEGYRLPTEAEWERAARAGTTTRFSHGDVLACDDECESCVLHDQHMWWCANNNPSGTKVTGSKTANGYGLFDMHGNVFELVWDRYGLYPDIDETDPIGPDVGVVRVARGGSYGYGARDSRSANRVAPYPTSKGNSMGFRLARTTDKIFVDGFETGDARLWSKTVPPDPPPDIESVSPAEGALHIPALAPIAITFTEPMNPATITANTTNTDCSATVQLSDDGFSTCIRLAAQPTTGDNTTFTVSPFEALESAATYRIRVTTDAQDPAGNPLNAVYTTAIGFTVRYAHSIVIDGTNDFIAADEELATSTAGASLFVSYDDLTLYVGLEHPDVVIGGTGNKFTYFLFSTDAGLATGNPTSSDGKAQFGQAGTSRMLYHWKVRIDGSAYSEFRIANGSDWNTDWGSGGKIIARANGYLEASFSLAEFGGIAPADLLITAYTVDYNGAGGDGWIYNMLAGATDGSGTLPRPLSGYVLLQLPSSLSPNNGANLGSF